MKTINCTLPIYNSLARQTFERANVIKVGHDRPVPVLCPRHRLPSYQYNTEAVAVGAVTKVEMFNQAYDASEVTVATDWAIHSGFDVNPSHIGLEISDADNSGGGPCVVTSGGFNTIYGTKIRFRGTLTLIGGTAPIIFTSNPSGTPVSLTPGANDIILTASFVGLNSLSIYYNGVTHYTLTGVLITKIENSYDITSYFPTLSDTIILSTDTYYVYNGDTLNYLLPEGTYYLKITHATGYVYWSDWFKVDCIYPNIISSWTNITYENDFASDETVISHGHETGTDGRCNSDQFVLENGESITIIFNLTLTSGVVPKIGLYDATHGASVMTETVVSGLNIITLTGTNTGDHYVYLYNDAAGLWAVSEVIVIRDYSTKYITIDFANSCDLGDIVYHEGFVQTLWLESETMEPSFPLEEEGSKNGEGRLVRTFRRQVKKYNAKTKEIPDFIVEVLHRMRLHDAIQLTDLVGNVNDIYNLEVEHEWLYDDKYYAKADLVFDYDEAFVASACCVDLI